MFSFFPTRKVTLTFKLSKVSQLAVVQPFAHGHLGKLFTINLTELNLFSKCIQAKSHKLFQFALQTEIPRKQNNGQIRSLNNIDGRTYVKASKLRPIRPRRPYVGYIIARKNLSYACVGDVNIGIERAHYGRACVSDESCFRLSFVDGRVRVFQ